MAYEFTSEEYDKSMEENRKYPFERICEACGRPFKTIAANQKICNRQHYHPCPVCNKITPTKGRNFNQWPGNCCSNACKHKLMMSHTKLRTCIICGEKFQPTSGINLICSRDHYVTCEICGKSFILPKGQRDITTCSRECSLEKTKRFYREKYGCDHPMQNYEVQKHHQQSMQEKYGVTHALKSEKFIRKQQETVQKTNMKKYGVPFACMLPQCAESQGRIISDVNYEARTYLIDHGVTCGLEKRLGKYSYDLVVESQKAVIEIDPTYTHSIIPTHWNISREFDYQLKKTQVAEENGYRCIHIFDWENKHQVLDMLLPRTVIGAKNCTIYKLNPDVAKEFISKNYYKGNCRGQIFFLGLVMDHELYQVMSFGKPRYSKSHDVELMRICTKIGYQIQGGATKLFKYATYNFGLNNIISYCDVSKYTGELFEILGMKLLRVSPPQEIWSKNARYITANLLRSQGAQHLLKDAYNPSLDNESNLLANGWLPIYDCGMKVFEYTM